jgi:hypothetical protein
MNEEQLKLLYDSYASKNGFSDYGEFKSLIGNENSRKIFFESSKKELGFKDYSEFNNLVGLKKKDESQPTYRKNLLDLASKPKKQNTLLGTEPQKKTSESVSSSGPIKSRFGKVAPSKPAPASMKKFSGLSSDDISKMKATNKPEANVVQQPSENPRDGFLDYLIDTAEVGILSAEKFLVDTPEMIYDLASQANMFPTGQIDRAVTEATGITPFKRMQKQLGFENIPSNILKEKIDGLNQRIQAKSQDYGGDPLSAIENGRYSDAAKLIAGSTLQSAPMMAIAIGTGGGAAGLTSIGVLTASGKYQENLKEKELSQNQRLLNAAGSGVLESTLGHFFSGASGAVAKKILKDKGVEAGSKILSNSFRRVAEKSIMKNPIVGLVGEVLEETAVEGGEQLNDFSVGLRDNFDGRAAINAGLSSLGLGGTNTVSVYGAKGYMSAKKYSQIKKTNKAISRLQNEINNEGISEESKKIFQIKSEELIANNKKALGEEIEKLKTLSSEDKALLNKTNSVIDEAMASFDNIKEDKTLSPEAKRIATAEIYKDYVEASKVKRGILSKLDDVKVDADFTEFTGVPLDFDVETSGVGSLPINKQNELNRKALDELNAELNPTGTEQVDITKDMVSKRANELYEKETEVVQPIQEDVIPTQEDVNVPQEDVVDENEKKVEELRSEEQVELKEKLPNAELNEEGKIDVEKLSTEDKAIYDEVYDRYDKLITPLLPKNEDTNVEDVEEEVKPVDVKDSKKEDGDFDTKAIDVFKAGLEAIKITKATSKAKLKALTDTVNSLVKGEDGKTKKGSISVKQANSIIKRIGNLNLDNPKTTDKLIEYVTNVVNNAEYKDKLDNLDSTISGIKSKIKSKNIDPELRDLAKKFVSIKPKNVDDIDAYFELADNINKNISGSTARGSKLNVAEGIDKAKLSEYVDTEIAKAREIQAKEIEDSFYESTGLDPKDFSYEDIQEMMYNPNEDSDKSSKYDELDLRSKIEKASETLKGVVSNIVNKGTDAFTGETVDLSSDKKKEIRKILDVNVNELSKQDSLLYIDILNDIIVNGDSNKMTLFNTKIDANNKAREASKTFSAKKVKLFGINSLARAWNEQIASLPLVSESMFKSIEKGEEFLNVIGFDNIRKGTNKATREVNAFFKGISDKYSKTKPNGEDFTSKFNDAERGMSAFMIMSTDDADFNRNKSLVEQSINNLSKGDESQREMAKVHKSVYDKILADSKSIDEVTSKADKLNVDVVNEFIEFNDSKYSDKESVSKSIYNSSLDNKKNYTPISYKKISSKNVKMDDIDAFDSSILSSKEKIYDKKSGTFIESKKPATVKSDSYISFDFLSDNERKMKESLVDTYTAKDIQFMKAFIESPYMEEIIPDLKDREVFVDRIKDYVKIKRNRQVDTAPEAAKAFSKFIDKTSRLAVARSLGGFGQALNQTIPVATSTLINSQRLDLIDATNKDWNGLIDNSGYDIANRGLESSSDYAAFSKILQQSSEGKVDKVVDLLSKGQEFWLKTFLGKPDVFIARASWISFYKKGLQEQGLSTDVDPKDHKINEQAARYAQAQVDRQQNPSDPSLEGKWLSSKNSGTKISRAVILPFAKFALNQKTRMYNDARILSSLSSSTQEKSKSALSLIGLAAEMAVFGYVSGYIRDLIEGGVDLAMGYEEEEDDKKKMDKQKKERAVLSFTSNVISPFPLVDFAFQELVGQGLDLAQDYYEIPKEDKINVKPFSDSGINKFGTLGISAQIFSDIPQYEKLVYDGKFKDKGGREKQISDEDLETLRALRLPFYLNQAGVLPREVSYAIKKAIKVSKERAGKEEGKGFSPRGSRF